MATTTPDLPAPPPAPSVASDPVGHTLAMLRPWIEYVPQKQRRLGLFIAIGLLLHMVVLYFIRIDNTRAELRHQTRMHVTVEGPQATSYDGRENDGFWDRLTDPRLYLFPTQTSDASDPDQPAVDLSALSPDFGAKQLPVPAAPDDNQISQATVAPVEQRVGDDTHPARQPFTYEATPPPIASTTMWEWDRSLAGRVPPNLPTLPSPLSDTDLSPTVLRVAVDPAGTVEHVLVDQSSGDQGAATGKDLDEQAVLAAQKIRFRSVDQPGLTWGRLTVLWHYSAKPREEVVPTPPSGP